MSGDVIVIEPTRGWAHLRLTEIWGYRELAYFVDRDILAGRDQARPGVILPGFDWEAEPVKAAASETALRP